MKKQQTQTKRNDKYHSRVSMVFRGQKTPSTQKSLIFQWTTNANAAMSAPNVPNSVKRRPEQRA
jgi:hypothetical protein